MQQEIAAIEEAVGVIERVEGESRSALMHLSNGIVLKARSIPPLYIQSLNQEFEKKAPKPPIWVDPEKGRSEPNPGDPDYRQALLEHTNQQELAVTNLVLVMGTSVHSLPPDKEGPETDGWLKSLEVIQEVTGQHFDIDLSNASRRYLAWLRYYALESIGDLTMAAQLPMHLAGLGEEEVQEAIDAFRGVQTRREDNGVPAEGQRGNGNQPNRAARRNGAAA